MENSPLPLAIIAVDEQGDDHADRDVALALRGDADSFLLLYETHVAAVYNYAYARLANRQDAEDVAAQVFEQVWSSLPRYRPSGSFKGWLFTIAHRQLGRFTRGRTRPATSTDALAEVLLDPAAGPEEQALVAESVRRVFAIIAALAPEQQEVITLRFLSQLPYQEIATVIGKREQAVKMIAYRALAEIRRSYEDE